MKIHDDARMGDMAGMEQEIAGGVAVDAPERVSGETALQIVCAMPETKPALIGLLLRRGDQRGRL